MADSRQLAVVFADVSGSTRLYERLGDRRALALIRKCLKVFEEVTRRFQGRIVKTIGDEVVAVFATAEQGCLAAMEMQVSVCSLPEALEHQLAIHCGLQFGEVMVSGKDIFGDTVNVAARLSGMAKGGQVVTSGEVLRALPKALAESTRFIDTEVVKGRVSSLEVYEVLWEPDAELTELNKGGRAGPSRVQVLVARFHEKEYEVTAAQPALTLGRDARADIVAKDKLASRHHGRIERQRGKFVYTDFSSNGSFVQVAEHDEIVVRRESIVLRDHGTISFGRPAQIDPEAAISFRILAAHQ